MSLPGDALEPAEIRQRLGDLRRQPDGVVPTQIDHLLCDAKLEQFAGQLDQLIPVLAIPTELERAADLGGVAAHRTAGIVEFLDDLGHELRVAARDVPHVRVASGQPERGLALGADPDRRVRLLDGLGIRDRVLEVVVAPVEVRSILSEQRVHDLQRFAQPADAMVESLDAVHLVLDLRPRGADPELETAAREVVDRDSELGQDDRVAIRVAGDQASDAHALGGLGHRRLERPALVNRAVGAAGPDGRKVVEVPQVVESAFVGKAPDRAQVLDGDALTRRLQPETKRMRHQWKRSLRTRMGYLYFSANSSAVMPMFRIWLRYLRR